MGGDTLSLNPRMKDVLSRGAFAVADRGYSVVVKGFLLSISHRYKNSAVELHIKSDNGEMVDVIYEGFRPYCYFSYAEYSDSIAIEDALRSIEGIASVERTKIKLNFGKKEVKAFKVFTDYPNRVPEIRDLGKKIDGVLDFHEADIFYHQRFIYDKQISMCSRVTVNCAKIETKWGYKLILRSMDDIEFEESFEEIPLRVCAFDIEVYNPKVSTNAKTDRITCISVKTNKEARIFSIDDYDGESEFDNERTMLNTFFDYVVRYDPDIIAHYNGDRYDIPYIVGRCEILGIKFGIGRFGKEVRIIEGKGGKRIFIPGRYNCDVWKLVERDVLDLPNKTLKNAADYLGIVKHEERLEIPSNKLASWWDKDGAFRELYKRYCIDDSVATYRILTEVFFKSAFAISRICHVGIDESLSAAYGALNSQYISYKLAGKGIIIPSKVGRLKGEKLKGAAVFQIKAGVYIDLECYDFKSLYPSIIIRDNLSFETFLEQGETASVFSESVDKVFKFSKEIIGILPEIAITYLDLRADNRAKYKRTPDSDPKKGMYFALQDTYKRLNNALYGMAGALDNRYYFFPIAHTITAAARNSLKTVAGIAENEFNRNVVYGDTDSIYIKKMNDEERPRFLARVQEITGLITELDYSVRKFISYGKKKKYAFIKVSGDIVVKGLESRRGDWSSFSSKTIEKLLTLILKEDDAGIGVSFVQKRIERIRTRNITLEELTVYKTITMELDDYHDDIGQVHVAAATFEKINYGYDAEVGDKFGVVIIKASRVSKYYPSLKTVPLDDIEGKVTNRAVWSNRVKNVEDIDEEYYIERQIIKPAYRILSVFGVSRSSLRRADESVEDSFGLTLEEVS